MPLWHSIKDRVWSVYNEAIAVVARRGAPLATGSIDRRSLKNFVGAFVGEGIQSLVCFSCARRFPRVATWRKNDIDWITVLNHVDICASVGAAEPNPSTFCKLTQEETQQIFGLDTYMAKYGSQGAGHPDLRELDSVAELREWSLDVPFGLDTVAVLCCPEDRQCLHQGAWKGNECAHNASYLCADSASLT